MRTLTHLQRLEAESIDITREAVSECEKPVMLCSVGKDSSVMLHLAIKAFSRRNRRSRSSMWRRPGSFEKCTDFAMHGCGSSAWS